MSCQTLLHELAPNLNPVDLESQSPGILRKIADTMGMADDFANGRPVMSRDPAQRHQIDQDAITAVREANCLAACDDAIALLREFSDLERDDDGEAILGSDENGHNDLLSRIAAFLAEHDQYKETAMTKLTETQTIILTAGAQRPNNTAMPLPKGLAGAAAKMAVTKMIERGWLQQVRRQPAPG